MTVLTQSENMRVNFSRNQGFCSKLTPCFSFAYYMSKYFNKHKWTCIEWKFLISYLIWHYKHEKSVLVFLYTHEL
jgi:hypothetical protein